MDIEQFNPAKFTSKEIIIYKGIKDFYKKLSEETKNKMYDIIISVSPISLRILDWFATEFSKNGIELKNIYDENVPIHISYKAHLRAFSKKYFDPFKRHIRFKFPYKDMETTIGQLNFFKWAIVNNIILYIDEHLSELVKIMNDSNLNKKKKKQEKKENSSKFSNQSSINDDDDNSDDKVNLIISF